MKMYYDCSDRVKENLAPRFDIAECRKNMKQIAMDARHRGVPGYQAVVEARLAR